MTCIIGLVQDGKVYMGGDSMASDGYCRRITSSPKVFKVGQFVIGYTDSFRMGQILRYGLEVRHQQDGETDERYMVVAFAEAVRECLKAKGFAKIDANEESGGELLVGYNGHLYHIHKNYQVMSYFSSMSAVGSGEHYALGAMLALKETSPEERIYQALSITSELSAMVSSPYYVEVL